LHPKISKDPFYSELYPDHGDDGIAEAGFFYDTDEELTDPLQSIDLICTPLAFEGVLDAENPAVLLSTGAFCPPHLGHLEMMQSAKAAVENAGYKVVAGYLSPGHDEYIEEKTREDAIPVYERIKLLQNLIYAEGDADWLAVDPWEGVFNKVAVNFTDVIVRLEAYLKKWTGRKIPVFYVCGADNARFALTFMKNGYCVVVERPGYELQFNLYKNKLAENKNIFWVEAANSMSSTKLRKENSFTAISKNKLLLRVEEKDEREFTIIDLLKPYFKEVQLQLFSEQQDFFNLMDKSALLSLDALLPADYNFGISRIYDLFGSRFLGFSERPGTKTFKEQIEQLPKDIEFTLFDDDMCHGSTLKYVQELLKNPEE
jgi:nicotinic acid mononucleotide adenylyltransferase